MKAILTKIIPSSVKRYLKEYKRKKFCSRKYKEDELNNPGEYYSINAFDYYKCIFIHIPKAAGISVNKALFGNYVGAHKSIKDYKKIYPSRTFNSYYKFTIVRNPWDRLYSAYTFLKKGGMNDFDYKFMLKELDTIDSFEQFVMEWLDEQTIYSYIHFIPQLNFLQDNEGYCPIDFIGRYENLNEDFAKIARRINSKTKLEHLNNTSRKITYKDVYTKEMILKVSILYKQDIDFFKYTY